MIYDKLVNISSYSGVHANLDIAIQYIETHDLNALPLGKTVLNDMVYINVMEAVAAPSEQLRYEIHKNYLDIQIDLTGTECIQIGDRDHMEIENYNSDTDFAFANCNTSTRCTMGPGNFIICMSSEPHMPGIMAGENRALKKCVFKVHV